MTQNNPTDDIDDTEAFEPDGYYCVVCNRFIHSTEDGVIVHDNVPHPIGMTFDDDEHAQ